MTDDIPQDTAAENEAQVSDTDVVSNTPDLPPAAQRALAEAAERRAAYEAKLAEMPLELGGREGPEPVRYGDYEKKGIAVDF